MTIPAVDESVGFAPRRARTGEAVKLTMQRLWLTGRLLPVGARLFVHHLFRSGEDRPLEIIYTFALPRDAALRRFRVTGESFSVRSELRPVAEAVKAYEDGVAAGRLSTLARQYADGIVSLTLGNLRPGETVTVSLELIAGVEIRDRAVRFRFPFTMAPAYHAGARASLSGGLGELELPEDEFEDLILPQWAADAADLHEVGFDLSVAMPAEIEQAGSPSHAVRWRPHGARAGRIALAPERDWPNRDLIVDVQTRSELSGVFAGSSRDGKGRLAAVIPSTRFGSARSLPRRVVFVLDRSGSMEGRPIQQARRACEACLTALSPEDRFGIVAFNDEVETLGTALLEADQANREAARDFLAKIDARGGTKMAPAIERAVGLLGSVGGEIFLITDGQIFGYAEVQQRARTLGARVHCLALAGGGGDRGLSELARTTGGVIRSVTARERVDLPALELFASSTQPVAYEVRARIEGLPGASILPQPPMSVFEGFPLVLFASTDGPGAGALCVTWKSDAGEQELREPLELAPSRLGETLKLLQGARWIADLESRHFDAQNARLTQRRERRTNSLLERVSLDYGLVSRAAALVAVIERPGDEAGLPPETRVVPVGMPEDTAFESYFACLRPASLHAPPKTASAPRIAFVRSAQRVSAHLPVEPMLGPPDDDAWLLELACRMEADGGMPGRDEEERALASTLALLCFLDEARDRSGAAFRRHVKRLIKFLERVQLPLQRRVIVEVVLAAARRGESVPGPWREILRQNALTPDVWDRIEAALPRAG